eukprot:TRINITY_DN12155_c0_g1_i1.p1 TRINITY_DN12155_c0_g1~~TRINITY_DN12155_c0_g1_i1.p1  ORF type:complete len:217 (-),score=36.20 TRINITY_DN12155_c0_g1_i1:76-663(-)
MACDPAKNDDVWKGVCNKEMVTWKSPNEIKALIAGQNYDVAPAPNAFRVPMPGEAVYIGGMRRRPELNGAQGEIVDSSLDEFGRVTVRIYDSTILGVGASKKMKIQPFRLVPMQRNPNPQRQMQASASAGNLLGDDRSSVRSCSRVGSVVSLSASAVGSIAGGSAAGSATRPLGSAINAGARGTLSRTPSALGLN